MQIEGKSCIYICNLYAQCLPSPFGETVVEELYQSKTKSKDVYSENAEKAVKKYSQKQILKILSYQ